MHHIIEILFALSSSAMPLQRGSSCVGSLCVKKDYSKSLGPSADTVSFYSLWCRKELSAHGTCRRASRRWSLILCRIGNSFLRLPTQFGCSNRGKPCLSFLTVISSHAGDRIIQNAVACASTATPRGRARSIYVPAEGVSQNGSCAKSGVCNIGHHGPN